MDSDELELLQRGEEEAWREWDVYIRPRLRRFFVFHGVGQGEYDDLTQETLRRVARRIAAFRTEDHQKLEAWVFTIARRVHAEWVRTRTRRPNPLPLEGAREPSVPPDESLADGVFDIRDLAPTLQRALARLSPRQREFFVLRHIQGMEPCEIAARHGCAPGTVYQTLATAKRKLKDALQGSLGEAVG